MVWSRVPIAWRSTWSRLDIAEFDDLPTAPSDEHHHCARLARGSAHACSRGELLADEPYADWVPAETPQRQGAVDAHRRDGPLSSPTRMPLSHADAALARPLPRACTPGANSRALPRATARRTDAHVAAGGCWTTSSASSRCPRPARCRRQSWPRPIRRA
jgi:hypothetical protein